MLGCIGIVVHLKLTVEAIGAEGRTPAWKEANKALLRRIPTCAFSTTQAHFLEANNSAFDASIIELNDAGIVGVVGGGTLLGAIRHHGTIIGDWDLDFQGQCHGPSTHDTLMCAHEEFCGLAIGGSGPYVPFGCGRRRRGGRGRSKRGEVRVNIAGSGTSLTAGSNDLLAVPVWMHGATCERASALRQWSIGASAYPPDDG